MTALRGITVLGVPFNGDGTRPEMENPALSLRNAGLVARLLECGHDVIDLGDVSVPAFGGERDPVTGVLNQEAWRAMTTDLARRVREQIGLPDLLLLLGGDCSLLSGVCMALRADLPKTGLMYLDGHADYRWPSDSPTGEPADLVLTALTGRIPGLFTGVHRKHPLVHEADVILFGFRDRDRIDESGILTFDAAQMKKIGVIQSVQRGLRPFGNRPLWLHFDVDVLDPDVMPAVAFPVEGGLSLEEAQCFLERSIATDRIVGIDVACYHPRLDRDGQGARGIVELLVAAVGPGAHDQKA